MANEQSSQWWDISWNPTKGCTKVSKGCLNCYAETFANFRFRDKLPYSEALTDGKWNGEVFEDASVLEKPYHWRKPRIVFVNSMSDLFHDQVSDKFRDLVWQVMFHNKQHTYIILTKRIKNMLRYTLRDLTEKLPNVWMGLSICTQKEADEIVPYASSVNTAKLITSIEPILEQIVIPDIQIFDWVIAGKETGTGARNVDTAYIEAIKDQCDLHRIPFWVKALHRGEVMPSSLMSRNRPELHNQQRNLL